MALFTILKEIEQNRKFHPSVRAEPGVILDLADFGISPRYLDWTLEAATTDLGVNLDRVVSKVQPRFDRAHLRAAV